MVAPGERQRFDLPAALLPTHTQLNLPLTVVNGLRPGPRVWLSAAVHGDELNGVEIIRRVLAEIDVPLRRGVVIAVPVVNVFGFIQQSRYLPDRRDLNRSFPGSKRGSLAGRIAHLFMKEIVERCTHGIDLHTASSEKSNLPQIRANLRDPETYRAAMAFDAPAMVQSGARKGSLREAAASRGIVGLVYEAGESRRFNKKAIQFGVRGVLGVLQELDMIAGKYKTKRRRCIFVHESNWIRAKSGGLLRLDVDEGDLVKQGQTIGWIGDPFGESSSAVKSPHAGLVLGLTQDPVVHGGDAVVHIGRVEQEA